MIGIYFLVVPGQTVMIVNDCIEKIGNMHDVEVPSGASVVDGTDKYLIPGLADMHTHYSNTLEKSYLNIFVAHGVTTIRFLPEANCYLVGA